MGFDYGKDNYITSLLARSLEKTTNENYKMSNSLKIIASEILITELRIREYNLSDLRNAETTAKIIRIG